MDAGTAHGLDYPLAMPSLRIGQVAALAGVAVDTVRYYERVGIIPAARRRRSGYRVFDETTAARILLVKELQELGLRLDEIGAMFAGISAGRASCASESTRIEAALHRTEEKIAALTVVRDRLRQALGRCASGACEFEAHVGRISPARA